MVRPWYWLEPALQATACRVFLLVNQVKKSANHNLLKITIKIRLKTEPPANYQQTQMTEKKKWRHRKWMTFCRNKSKRMQKLLLYRWTVLESWKGRQKWFPFPSESKLFHGVLVFLSLWCLALLVWGTSSSAIPGGFLDFHSLFYSIWNHAQAHCHYVNSIFHIAFPPKISLYVVEYHTVLTILYHKT